MPAILHPPITLQAGVGQPLVIALDAMPGAGMTWQPPAAPAGCTLAEGELVPAGSGIGGPMKQQFILTCTQRGEHTLSFDYKRPWEAEVRAVQAVVVRVG